jgi:hypothetical protein
MGIWGLRLRGGVTFRGKFGGGTSFRSIGTVLRLKTIPPAIHTSTKFLSLSTASGTIMLLDNLRHKIYAISCCLQFEGERAEPCSVFCNILRDGTDTKHFVATEPLVSFRNIHTTAGRGWHFNTSNKSQFVSLPG